MWTVMSLESRKREKIKALEPLGLGTLFPQTSCGKKSLGYSHCTDQELCLKALPTELAH